MKRRLLSRRGETLVEVMCAGALLLIALGTLLGAVRFSSGSERYAGQMRRWTAELRQSLGETDGDTEAAAAYAFTGVSADGAAEETETLFTVRTALITKNGVYTTADGGEETVTFRLFAPPEGGA